MPDYQALLNLSFVHCLVTRQLEIRGRHTLRSVDGLFYLEDTDGNLRKISQNNLNNAGVQGIMDACQFYTEHVDDPFAIHFHNQHMPRSFNVAFLQTLYIDRPDTESPSRY